MDFLKHMRLLAKRRAAGLKTGMPEAAPPVRSFRRALKGMAVIAEVKYATPADGHLGIRRSPSSLAAVYQSHGAAAISCVTEPVFFAGSVDYLPEIRSSCMLPLLMKDFIVDERQLCQARALGADAALLITELLSIDELARLHSFCRSLGMDCLVEVHGREGLDKALKIGADIIGVNVRDLATLKVDPRRHEEMAGLLPSGVAKVAESGISSSARLKELGEMGYDAALIGRAVVSEQTRGEIFRCG
ncbi:MAG TPA: indole-3-glycerol-phosphate synthase [Deltaproteobacteria bacterium]|nr:indole-3-glycerol-phosphate synthase [Deltaproteobacteria bacterium]